MSEIDARAAYEEVVAELQRQVPWLHEQVLAEIGRGRELKANQISQGEFASRNKELASQDLSRLSESDLAVVDLTFEERLIVTVRAISVAVDAYNASVGTLSGFAHEHGTERYEFVSPGDDGLSGEDVPYSAVGEDETRSAFVIPEETVKVSREAIDAVLEALDTDE